MHLASITICEVMYVQCVRNWSTQLKYNLFQFCKNDQQLKVQKFSPSQTQIPLYYNFFSLTSSLPPPFFFITYPPLKHQGYIYIGDPAWLQYWSLHDMDTSPFLATCSIALALVHWSIGANPFPYIGISLSTFQWGLGP